MNNKDLINEGFFSRKNKSYEEQLANKYPQYSPVNKKGPVDTGLNAIGADNTRELKRRLTGTLGVALGNNTVKNMASRAIKRFPIIISEQVDPSTAVLLKNYLEAQYAEYINLLISNQVIDLADYDRNSPDGNIAIQALDHLTAADFGKQRVANKAMGGELTANDLFSNVPIYQLLRQESVLHTGDENVDNILESALVVDAENVDLLVEYMMNEKTLMDTIYDASDLDDKKLIDLSQNLHKVGNDPDKYSSELSSNNAAYSSKSSLLQHKTQALRSMSDNAAKDLAKRGYVYTDNKGYEHYDRLTNTEIVADPHLMSAAVNETVGELLLKNTPTSKYLRDRFEKATWLLQSRIIAGTEYAAYVMHLGLPIRKEVYADLIKHYPAKHLIIHGQTDGLTLKSIKVIDAKEAELISKGKRQIPKVVEGITKVKVKDIFKVNVAIGAGAGAGAGVITVAAIAALAAVGPIGWTIGVGAGAAAGGLGTILYNIFKKRNTPSIHKKIESANLWERVEELIQEMDDNTYRLKIDAAKWNIKMDEEIGSDSKVLSDKIKNTAEKEYNSEVLFDFSLLNNDKKIKDLETPTVPGSLDLSVNKFKQSMQRIYEAVEPVDSYFEDPLTLTESSVEFYEEVAKELNEETKELLEKITKISLMKPGDVSFAKKQMPLTVLKYNDAKDYVVPSYGTANMTAYGSVDYDRRDLKDRKFNTPLIMTVKFKERYSDGSYADNELTAVIGILGVITRIPSEEMEYILKTNAQGTTLKSIFSGDDKDSLADLFSSFKSKGDYSKLTQSADTWKNLERVSHLALANKMAGKINNNVANAHIIFSQKEMDSVRQETGVDYIRDRKVSASLMKRYSAMNLMVANDTLERVFIFNDIDSASWDVVPYDALRGRDSSDLMASIANKFR